MEMQIGYQHLLLEISKDLLNAESTEILEIIRQTLYDVGQLLLANSIVIQLFNDLDDTDDDVIVSWSINSEQVSPIDLNEDLFDFFILNQPFISKGTVVEAFGNQPFEYDNLVYSMYVNCQPIGFLKIELTDITHLNCIKKMVSHTVEIFTRAIERMNRDTMFREQSELIHKTLLAIDFSVIVASSRGKVELLNLQAERLLAKEESQCLGKAIDQIIVLDAYENSTQSFFGDLIEKDDELPFTEVLTIINQEHNLDVRCRISPIYSEDYLYQGAVIILERSK